MYVLTLSPENITEFVRCFTRTCILSIHIQLPVLILLPNLLPRVCEISAVYLLSWPFTLALHLYIVSKSLPEFEQLSPSLFCIAPASGTTSVPFCMKKF